MEKIKPWHFYLISLVIGLVISFIQTTPGYMDSQYYYLGGLQIFRGNGLQEPFLWNYLDNPAGIPHLSFTYWMPLPSLFSALGMFFAGNEGLFFARIPFILLISLMPIITMLIASNLGADKRYQSLAGFSALFPGFYWVYWTLPESFAFYMVLGGLFTLLASKDLQQLSNKKLFVSCLALGILAGLMHMSRADGILWVLIGLVALNYRLVIETKRSTWIGQFKKTALRSVIFIVGYLTIASAWYLRNCLFMNTLMPSGGSKTLWLLSYNETFRFPSDSLTMMHLFGGGIGLLIINRFDALFSNLANFIGVQCSIFLLPLVLLGFWKTRHTYISRFSVSVWLLILAVMSIVFPFAGARGGYFHSASALQAYIWALVPIGFNQFIEFGVQKRGWNLVQSSKIFSGALVVLALIFSVFIFSNRVVGSDSQNLAWNTDQKMYQEIDQILMKNNAPSSARVIVINPPGYYLATNREAIVTPDGDISVQKLVSEKYQACYLILEKDHVEGLNSLYISPNSDEINLIAIYNDNTFIYQLCDKP